MDAINLTEILENEYLSLTVADSSIKDGHLEILLRVTIRGEREDLIPDALVGLLCYYAGKHWRIVSETLTASAVPTIEWVLRSEAEALGEKKST